MRHIMYPEVLLILISTIFKDIIARTNALLARGAIGACLPSPSSKTTHRSFGSVSTPGGGSTAIWCPSPSQPHVKMKKYRELLSYSRTQHPGLFLARSTNKGKSLPELSKPSTATIPTVWKIGAYQSENTRPVNTASTILIDEKWWVLLKRRKRQW